MPPGNFDGGCVAAAGGGPFKEELELSKLLLEARVPRMPRGPPLNLADLSEMVETLLMVANMDQSCCCLTPTSPMLLTLPGAEEEDPDVI